MEENTNIPESIKTQRKEQTTVLIKKIITLGKVIDLDILSEIESENDFASMFDFTDQSYNVGQSITAIRNFCMEIRQLEKK